MYVPYQLGERKKQQRVVQCLDLKLQSLARAMQCSVTVSQVHVPFGYVPTATLSAAYNLCTAPRVALVGTCTCIIGNEEQRNAQQK